MKLTPRGSVERSAYAKNAAECGGGKKKGARDALHNYVHTLNWTLFLPALAAVWTAIGT